MNDLFLAGTAVAGGIAVGGLLYLAVRPRRPALVPLEIIQEEEVVPLARARDDRELRFDDDAPFSVASPVSVPVHVEAAPAPRAAAAVPPPPRVVAPIAAGRGPPPRAAFDRDVPPEPPASPIPTEWARRLVGPLDAGRTKGVCSGCGTHLSVSTARPVRIACPVCGRTRLLAA